MSEENKGTVIKKKRKINWIYVLVGIFAFIFLFLVYTSFVNPGFGSSVTGNIVRSGEVVNGVPISANLEFPGGFSVNSMMEKLDLKVVGSFSIGDQVYELDRASVVIDNFQGSVGFNDEKTIVDGKATKVYIDGIPISGKLKVYFNNDYSYIKLTNFYLPSMSYTTTGSVKVGDNNAVVDLRDEGFMVEGFQGNLEKSKNSFKLNGNVNKAKIGLVGLSAEDVVVEEVEDSEDSA